MLQVQFAEMKGVALKKINGEFWLIYYSDFFDTNFQFFLFFVFVPFFFLIFFEVRKMFKIHETNPFQLSSFNSR